MHMIHVEDRFISKDGKVDFASAAENPYGLAILGILFNVDPKKPQVCGNLAFILICITKREIIL